MSEMELMKRIEALEKRVAELESTIDTIKDIGKSERMAEFIDKKKRANSMINLIQQISGESIADTAESEQSVSQMEDERKRLEQSISEEFDELNIPIDNLSIDEKAFVFDEVDGGLEITGYQGPDTDCLVIPSHIDGKRVVGIGHLALNNINSKKVFIMDGIQYISDSAFFQNTSLRELYIGNDVGEIYEYAFNSCSNLKKVSIGRKVKTIGDCSFSRTGIRNIVIPEGVERIGSNCFKDCSMLQKVVLNAGIKSLGQTAFENTRLEKVILPETIDSLGLWVFKNSYIGSSIEIAFLGKKHSFKNIKPFADKTQNNVTVYCEDNTIKDYAHGFGFIVRPLLDFQFR